MKLYTVLFATSVCLLVSRVSLAQTSATTIRLRTDPVIKKVIIDYELPQVLPGDSIYIELETASGRILRPVSVKGDVGSSVKAGTGKLIAWDVVKDNVRLNEDVKVLLRVARMVTVTGPATIQAKPEVLTVKKNDVQPPIDRAAEPGSVVRKKSPIPLVGWVAAAGLTGYATVLALGLNKDADEYNAKPYADNATDLQHYNDLKSKIDKGKGTFTIVAGAAATVAIATVIYTLVAKPKPARTSLLIQSGNRVTSVGVSHTF